MTDKFQPFVSVITPTYMRAADVEKAVRSALDQSWPADRYEIVVADGSSSDGTAARIAALQLQYSGRIVFLKEPPLGPSASRNAAAAVARGEILALLDSDCVADRDWIRNGVALFEGRPQLGMVQGRTMPPPGAPLVTRARYVWVDHSNSVHEACNMFYRREAFESAAGFSRDFYMHARPHGRSWFEPVLRWLRHYGLVMRYSGEDTDLGWHVLSNGWEKEYCPDALVYHDVRILTWSSWLIDEGCYAYGAPRLVRKYPQARNGLFWGYFLGPAQVCILLLMLALPFFVLNKAAFLFALPYVWLRGSEPTRFWRGWKRAFRFLVYLPRDVATFTILMASSLRHGRLVV